MLLDTDVLIDVALDRHPYQVPACGFPDRLLHGSVRALTAWRTASNLYILSPESEAVPKRVNSSSICCVSRM